MKTLVLCCVSLALVVLVNAQCDPPSESRIESDLTSILKNQVGEDPSVTVDVSKYHYTCQAIYAYNKYREVSLIIEYTRDGNADLLYAQIQLFCLSTGGNNFEWDRKNEFTQRNNDNLFSLTTRVNCSACSKDDNDNSHCEDCHSDCSSIGLGACTGGGASDCCLAFDTASEECVASCPMNLSPNETFFCACGIVCGPGYMLNSSQCSCILNDTCLANTPCANNGTCVLGSSPDNYTCDCTGTNFMGVNCSVPEPPTSSSSSAAPTTTSSSVSPTPSPTNKVCNANCTTCDSMGCCSRCVDGFNQSGCYCVSILPPLDCNVRGCESCSSSDCCSQCEDGYEVDRENACSCVSSTSSSSVSPSPSDTNPTRRSQGLGTNTLAGIAISVAVSVLMLIVLIAVVGHIIYYYLAVAAVAGHKTKASTLFGNGKVVPLNVQKSIDTERIYTEFDGDSETATHSSYPSQYGQNVNICR